MNYFKTVLLMVSLMGLCLLIGNLLGGATGMVLGFVLAAAMNFGAYWFSDRMLLAMHRAREVTAREEPALHNAVRKMTSAAAHLYIMNPFARGGFLANLFSTHPPVERRVARLVPGAGERI